MFGTQYQNPMQSYGQPSFQNPYLERLQALQQPQASRSEIVQVNGEQSLDMLPMGPRSSLFALDISRKDILLGWFVQTDDACSKSKTPYILTLYQPESQKQNEYVTRQEFEELKGMIANAQPFNANGKPAAPAAEKPDGITATVPAVRTRNEPTGR